MQQDAQAPVFSVPVKNGGETGKIRIVSKDQFLNLHIAYVPPETADLWLDYPLPFPFDSVQIEAPEDFFAVIRWKKAAESHADCMAEPLRQQFHFTPARGWLNDPNGLYRKDGVYHLFFQHNPLNTYWANMHWSHAESTDLIHWRETGIALYPDNAGSIYSGSAFIDFENAAGFGRNAVLLFYTNCNYDGKGTQNLAYSTDGGKSFRKYDRNPLIPNLTGKCDRDPVVAFDPEAGVYRMAVYFGDEDKREFGLFASHDLLHWDRTDTYLIPGGRECPGLTRMQDEQTGEFLWVFSEANMFYRLGTISAEGKITFRTDSRRFLYGDAYAGQRFFTMEDDRTVFISWLRMPGGRCGTYSGSMTLPAELHLVNGALRILPAVNVPGTPGELADFTDFSVPDRRTVPDLKNGKFMMGDTEQKLPDNLPEHLRGTWYRDRASVEFFAGDGSFAIALRTV